MKEEKERDNRYKNVANAYDANIIITFFLLLQFFSSTSSLKLEMKDMERQKNCI